MLHPRRPAYGFTSSRTLHPDIASLLLPPSQRPMKWKWNIASSYRHRLWSTSINKNIELDLLPEPRAPPAAFLVKMD